MAEVTGRGGYKQLFGRKQRAAGFKYKTVDDLEVQSRPQLRLFQRASAAVE